MLNNVFILLILFQVKHYLADYLLQGKYMLGKFNRTGWFKPLAAHAGVHAAFTAYIAAFFFNFQDFYGVKYLGASIGLGLLDFVAHFTMDRIKASPNLLGRFRDYQTAIFWNILGFDQGFHHLTHYLIIFILMYISSS